MEAKVLKNFIVFEGIDGAGKSTQLKLLEKHYAKKKIFLHATREPHDGLIGPLIRKVLHTKSHQKNNIQDQVFFNNFLAHLFATDRFEHLYDSGGILSALKSHHMVISDRYLFSSLAYQGEPNTINLAKTLNSHFPLPELLLYFDISPKVALQRIQRKDKDILENYENLEQVYCQYQNILEEYKTIAPDMCIHYIDARESQESVFIHITEIIENTIKN